MRRRWLPPTSLQDPLLPRLSPAGRLLLGLLCLLDVALIAAHLSLKLIGQPSGWTFDLGAERGYGELAQYLKAGWLAALLLLVAALRRAGVFVAWAALFLFIGADDWFAWHEQAGARAAATWPDRGDWVWHLGELAMLTGLLLAFLVVAVPLHLRSRGTARAISRRLFWLTAALGAFGVGVDAIHHLLFNDPWADVPFTVIEDGGELVILSAITAFAFAAAERALRPDGPRPGGAAGALDHAPDTARGPDAARPDPSAR